VGKPAPFYENLFEINYILCREFRALSPFEIESEKYTKIIKLYANLARLKIREEQEAEQENQDKNKPKIIRRPAGDDWF
jgi:hypothetical protein